MGKKSGPAAPAAPDPVQTSQAQSAANIETARAQQTMNMVGTSGPTGSVNWVADASQPGGYRQVTALSAPEQGIYDAQKATELGATNIAHDQLGRVQTALNTPLDTNGLPALQGAVNGGALQQSFDPGAQVQTGFNQGPQVQTGFSPGGAVQTGVDIQNSFDRGGQLQYGFDPGQQVQGQVGGDLNTAQLLAQAGVYGQAQSRLDPRFAQDENALRTRLANQGLGENSDAYQTAMQNFGRTKNDAYDQAIFGSIDAGQNAAQDMFGRQLSQGQFANTAAGQQYAQNQGQAAFNNATAGQDFGQNQQAAGFYNDANLAQMAAQNAAQAQQFGQNQAMAQFGNQAAGQIYGQNQGAAQFNNQGAAQQFGQNATQAQFGNSVQNQGFNQGQANAQLSNTARQQGLNERAYVQNQPINQLTGLLSLGQVGNPQGIQYSPTQVANTDVLGAYALQSQAQQANANRAAQSQSGLMNGLMSLGGAAIMASDERLKTDVRLLRRRPDGLGQYAFRYITDPEDVVRIGVMAQEVKKVRPDLVVKRPDGFLAVSYALLEAA